MTIAVDIAATSDSYGEFLRNFEQQLNQSIVTAFQGASATVESIMATAEEDGNFDPSSIAALAEDDLFKEFMEVSGREMLDFTSSNYSEKYAIIAEYYANVKNLEVKALEISKQNYQRDLEEY
jgi:carbohydrate-binding DOMON domain-containing protein